MVHVFRTWLSGTMLMVKNNGAYLEKLTINEKDFEIILSNEEKLSMWTIIALTHDLGYPLQKAKISLIRLDYGVYFLLQILIFLWICLFMVYKTT